MKKFILTAAVGLAFATISAHAQTTVIFSETFGAVNGTTLIANHSFDNEPEFVFSGAGDIRNTSQSSYSGASGGANLFLTNNGTANLIISGIDTTGYVTDSFTLTFGALKTTTASNMSELSVSWSTDGTSYTSMAIPAQPTGSGTSVWRSITLTGLSLPSDSDLYLMFQNTGTGPQFRIDDIQLTATAIPEPSTYAAVFGGLALVGAMIYRRRVNTKPAAAVA